MASVNSNALVYDALGRMVENTTSSGTREYVYAPGGSQVLGQMNGQTPVQVQYPLPGGGLAMYSASGTLTYAHPDWLGSSRLVTSTTQTCIGDSAYAPFGEPYGAPVGIPCRGPATYDFTGQQQWTVTASAGNAAVDDFPFREYHPVQGRWITPDPAGRGAVDITNPQTWNRYAYLSNNPLNAIDPLGLFEYCPSADGCTWDVNNNSGSYGSYDATVVGPGTDGFGASVPTDVQVTGSNGVTYQLDSSGQWYNTSAGEELSQSSVQELGLPDPSSFYSDLNSPFSDGLLFAGQRKGERGRTAKPDNPAKHAKPSTKYPGRWLVKDPHTGNWVLKPPGWTPNQNMDITPEMPSVPIYMEEIPWWRYLFQIPTACFPDPNTEQCL